MLELIQLVTRLKSLDNGCQVTVTMEIETGLLSFKLSLIFYGDFLLTEFHCSINALALLLALFRINLLLLVLVVEFCILLYYCAEWNVSVCCIEIILPCRFQIQKCSADQGILHWSLRIISAEDHGFQDTAVVLRLVCVTWWEYCVLIGQFVSRGGNTVF